MEEALRVHGLITAHELPEDMDNESFRRYWARLGEREKQRCMVAEGENRFTRFGKSALGTLLTQPQQHFMWAFFQILSVGNGAISFVSNTDTSVAGDGFTTGARKVPAAFSIVGTTSTLTTNFASGDAVGTWTNLGAYGQQAGTGTNATTSAGSGVLYTHALFSFTKGSSPVAIAYSLTLSN